MGFVKKCDLNMRRANEGYGMGLVKSSSFGRKRIAFSSIDMEFGENDNNIPITSLKRHCNPDSFFCAEKPTLEDLPQEILIRILCGVEHDDLKRLFFVSKSIREATLIVKQSHFAYSTPRKTVGFTNVEDFGDFNEVEAPNAPNAPNAPKQSRVPRSRLSAKKLANISVALFASGNEDYGPKRDLFMEMEIGI